MSRGDVDRGLVITGVLAVLLVAGAVAAYLATRTDELPTHGPSMRPTFTGSKPVEIDTDAYEDGSPRAGDIVVLQGPEGFERRRCGAEHPPRSPCPVADDDYADTRLLKRVVGVEGDSIAFAADGGLIRNGARVREPYIHRCPDTCALPEPITVPADHVFVAGDNRANSSDSRIWGAVPVEAIDGRVLDG